MSHHLVGVAEVATMLGVSRQRVDQLASSYADFPAPEVELAAGRVWSRSAIETWMALHHGRKAGAPAMDRMSFERFTDRARRAVVRARQEAVDLNHSHIGCEHLLLGLIAIGEGLAFEAFDSLGLDAVTARATVEQIVGKGIAAPDAPAPFTPRAVTALAKALEVSVELGHNYIGTEHLALGILREGGNVGCRVLTSLGLPLDRVQARVIERMGAVQPASASDADEPAAGGSFLEQVMQRLDAIDERLGSLERRLDDQPPSAKG